jgi:hypothetical protein
VLNYFKSERRIKVQAIEFECQMVQGIIEVPESFQKWHDQTVKVILLSLEESSLPDQMTPETSVANYLALMKQYVYAQPGQHWSREELNER